MTMKESLFLCVICLLSSVRQITPEELKVFDNYDHGVIGYGPEEVVVDYASLVSDPAGDFPDSFTICSSVHLKFLTTIQPFFQLYSEDGRPWINLFIYAVRDLVNMYERFALVYDDEIHIFYDIPIPISPHTWFHACTGLDTDTGHLRVVINGFTVVDEVIEFFIKSSKMKPKSLSHKLTIFKTNLHGEVWYQARGILSNMNVHGILMKMKDMVAITSSTDCVLAGDYLAWGDMNLNISGSVDERTIEKDTELCHKESTNIVLFTDIFVEWEECMLFCSKIQKARAPAMIATGSPV